MARMVAAKPQIEKEHSDLLGQRYDLADHPAQGVTMSRGTPVQTGVRAEGITGRGWAAVSPRLSAKYFVNRDFAVTGAVGRFSQWTHSLDREDIPVRLFDFWVASDATTPAVEPSQRLMPIVTGSMLAYIGCRTAAYGPVVTIAWPRSAW